ncbi:MAG: hypothetical protein NT133_06230 [Alphaproteobacteria bacterium]|nr:hypothetical protein [Alphaproteobacteria bacterium]
MQHRYVGDIGDFVKFAILRALFPEHRLGIAWWLYPDENHNEDGRHIDYLNKGMEWRHRDPGLFDSLRSIVDQGVRNISELERSSIIPGAVFANEPIPIPASNADRARARRAWFSRAVGALSDCDAVFADPDNGLEPDRYSPSTTKAGKSIELSEVRRLAANGRCAVVYHHQTRRKGGHLEEIEYWCKRLRDLGFARVDALRASPYSPRAFFIINATDDIRSRARELHSRWQGKLTWHLDGASSAE